MNKHRNRIENMPVPRRNGIYIFNIMRPFTLFELLVVIMIIAVLAAILLPALKMAQDTGTRIACAGQTRQYGIANNYYSMDFDGYHVKSIKLNGGAIAEKGDTYNALYDYWILNGKNQLRYVATGGGIIVKNNNLVNTPIPFLVCAYMNRDFKMAMCPAEKLSPGPAPLRTSMGMGYQTGYPYSYGVNLFLAGSNEENALMPPIKIGQVPNPSSVITLTELRPGSAITITTYFIKITMNQYPYMHGASRNYLYLDGHVTPYTKEQMLSLPKSHIRRIPVTGAVYNNDASTPISNSADADRWRWNGTSFGAANP